MGMFDHIICDHELPDGFDATGIIFQTKDIDNDLDTYTITDGGRLIHHYREWETTPDSELPDPKRPFFGSIREKAGSQKQIDKNYHGDLYFYSSNICGGGPAGFMTENDEAPWAREYTARFTNGKLESIVLQSDEVGVGNQKHITRKEFHESLGVTNRVHSPE